MTAGRPPHVLRPVKLTTNLPEDLRAKMDIHLFSTVENRVPHGAYSKFLAELVKQFFDGKTPDTVAFTPSKEEVNLGQQALVVLVEIATTDLRTGWSPDKITKIVAEARRITGRRP